MPRFYCIDNLIGFTSFIFYAQIGHTLVLLFASFTTFDLLLVYVVKAMFLTMQLLQCFSMLYSLIFNTVSFKHCFSAIY